jgi:hypothetical protein
MNSSELGCSKTSRECLDRYMMKLWNHVFSLSVRCSRWSNHEAAKRPVAQWSEQGTHNPLVGGSNPSRPTNFPLVKNADVAKWQTQQT